MGRVPDVVTASLSEQGGQSFLGQNMHVPSAEQAGPSQGAGKNNTVMKKVPQLPQLPKASPRHQTGNRQILAVHEIRQERWQKCHLKGKKTYLIQQHRS